MVGTGGTIGRKQMEARKSNLSALWGEVGRTMTGQPSTIKNSSTQNANSSPPRITGSRIRMKG